jgi:DNA polymerase-4/DNA polymerase V
MKKDQAILHIDGDAFFVGVEVAKNSKLKGLPVVTGEERGIVSALSYEAKALGITRGMPIFKVNKKFPSVIVLPGDYKSYVKYSKMMFNIVRRYADDVEEYSIDECFADLTGLELSLKMSYKEMAETIKKEVNDELDLSVSLGVASTKVLAKIASNWQKPNGLTVIEKDNIKEYIDKVPIEKIWGVGPKTSAKFIDLKVTTAGEFARKSMDWVRENFSKPYLSIWKELNGDSVLGIDPIIKTKYSSIQKTKSFNPFTNDRHFLLSQISKNIEGACSKARHYGLFPRKVSIFLKTQDFEMINNTISVEFPTNAPETIISLCNMEFDKIYTKGIMYRTTGVTLQDLVSTESIQTDLFGESNDVDKFETIHNSIDLLEKKFNKKMVYLASTHSAIKHQKKGTESDDLDSDLLFL